MRAACPAYGSIRRTDAWQALPAPLGVEVGASTQWARTWETVLPGSKVPAYFLENHDHFARPEVYTGPWGAHADNDLRYAFLCRGALALCQQLDWIPDVIHCHDWTTGLLPLMLNTTLRDTPLGRAATVFTIHNLEHQGDPPSRVVDFARLPWAEIRRDGLEAWRHGEPDEGGAVPCDRQLSTVSPTYAAEVRTPDGGFGLDGVLRYRAGDLAGILNGIDDESWSST